MDGRGRHPESIALSVPKLQPMPRHGRRGSRDVPPALSCLQSHPAFMPTFRMPSLPAQPRLTVPLEVYYFDTDAGGVVHNIAYLRMVEIARSQLAASLGWTLEDMGRTGLVPVVARTEIDYLRPAKLGDALAIDAELAGLEKVRMYMRFDIRSARDPQIFFARCTQTMVTVQLPGGRPQRVPEAWREAYPQLAR
jgi:YbgC/YbaW family acyl-CoA thioester hydrolase